MFINLQSLKLCSCEQAFF
uniref:Uncharacterized protein n=1 Tax=Anguilla anguilla TaxID=7936 RepID=A0A0E9S840_ANGAN